MDYLRVERGGDAEPGQQDVPHAEVDQQVVAGVARAARAERAQDEEKVAQHRHHDGHHVQRDPAPLQQPGQQAAAQHLLHR